MLDSEKSKNNEKISYQHDIDRANLLFSCGHFSKSLIYFEKSMEFFKKKKDWNSYLSCQFYVIQILNELQELEKLNSFYKEFETLSKEKNFSEKPLVIGVSAYYALYVEKNFESMKTSLNKALKIAFDQYDQSIKSEDILKQNELRFDIIFCLYIYSIYYYEIMDYVSCIKELDNLNILLKDFLNTKNKLEKEVSLVTNHQTKSDNIRFFQNVKRNFSKAETMIIGIRLMRVLIQIRQFKDYKKADKILWSIYEEVNKNTNIQHFRPYVLCYMSWCHSLSNNKEQAEIFYNLAVKSVPSDRKLFLSYLKQIKEQDFDKSSEKLNYYDIIFDTVDDSLIEKQKGEIDLKSQFILIDLLKILLLNQGKSYSKEEIVKQLWKNSYNQEIHDNKIYVTIKRLREAIEMDSRKPHYICRNSGGYYFSKKAKVLIKSESNV
ncbi:MAG: winged helix-turn-helix domain-containing protein [Bdellovibrionales bacterium]|nr:winged helix-turn-helix domain-containing protein [Bdellovibrionales bacterium]